MSTKTSGSITIGKSTISTLGHTRYLTPHLSSMILAMLLLSCHSTAINRLAMFQQYDRIKKFSTTVFTNPPKAYGLHPIAIGIGKIYETARLRTSPPPPFFFSLCDIRTTLCALFEALVVNNLQLN
jgi:hypothetical protein